VECGAVLAARAPSGILDVMTQSDPRPEPPDNPPQDTPPVEPKAMPREIGGPAGPEPTRYGDWEKNGRVSDF
jgi:Protein of unknown function (DUF1674)